MMSKKCLRLFLWMTILFCIPKAQHWNYMTIPCVLKIGRGGQNMSLPPLNNSLYGNDIFQWYTDRPTVTNRLCLYQNNEYYVQSNEDISNIKWQCTKNHTLILINLTATYSRNYYFQSLKTLGQGIPRPNSLCYNVSVHLTHQTHCHTTTLSLYPPTPVHNSLTISPSLASTNFTHVTVHHAAGNVEAQHKTATPHTTWIIPLVIIITIIILICFKFPQKAWNKFTQYRYSDMLAAA
uniref:Membrane glycoprotein UL9 n=2 Tax=Human cytomegalovirus TaxID=10359 RepID=J7EHF2_HCMV|nr:membrane glycoprotein UL9 [Human betaherpesvirus 5]ACV66134.1 membrane glycoprotein UL9 [Human betaherpesvirus 5]